MYDNIGGKIKGAATVVFLIEAIMGIIAGIIIMAANENFIVLGLLVMVFVPIIAYISSWLLYGFGELIEKTCSIESTLRGTNGTTVGRIKSEAQSKSDAEKMKKLDSLRSQGIISEEEYINALSESK